MKNTPLYLHRDLEIKSEFLNFTDFEKEAALSLRNHGYFVIKNLVDHKLIDEAINDCENKYNVNGMNNRILDAFTFSNNVKQIANNKKVINLLTTIYGSQSFPFQTLNFEYGTEQKLHSDMVHFSSFPKYFMAGCWVAYEDVTLDNGPLQYVDGSHYIPDITPQDIGGYEFERSDKNNQRYYEEFYEPYIENLVSNLNLKKSYATIKKGDAFIWCANLIHGGSFIKKKQRTRLSQVTHYYFQNCVYYVPRFSDVYNSRYDIKYPRNILKMKMVESENFFNAKNLNLDIKYNWANFLFSKPFLIRKFLSLLNLLSLGKLKSFIEKKENLYKI